MKKTHSAFTLVELIVVIVILAILATIAFLSFNNYSTSARDSDRLSDMTNITKGLSVLYTTSGVYPIPDNFITITAGTGYSIYQGTAGSKTLNTIKMSEAKDYLDNTYYSYSTDLSRTHYTVGGYLESAPTGYISPIDKNITNAIDYSKRYLIIKGDSVGILTESGTNSPIEQTTTVGTTIDLTNTSKNLILNTSKTNSISGTGLIVGIIQSNQNGGYSTIAPTNCPTGFIPVPGNSDFNQPGFCVMKYEAKALNGIINSGTNGHNYIISDTIVSNAQDVPVVTITQSGAISSCRSIGIGYHLITENERMTIARNIEQISSNWSGGIIGSGYIYSGHNDNAPAYSLTGSTDDNQGYYMETNTGGNQRRTHYLSNGQVIWDLAGNVQEHVNKSNTLDGTNYNDGANWLSNACSGSLVWTSFYGNDGILPCTYNIGYSYSNIGPKTPNLNALNGIGRIYSNTTANNIFIRGGHWAHVATAGIFTIGLIWDSSTAITSTGFRCAK